MYIHMYTFIVIIIIISIVNIIMAGGDNVSDLMAQLRSEALARISRGDVIFLRVAPNRVVFLCVWGVRGLGRRGRRHGGAYAGRA